MDGWEQTCQRCSINVRALSDARSGRRVNAGRKLRARPLKPLGQTTLAQRLEDSMRRGHRFKLGSIEGSKKSSFGPYVTPPKRLRIFDFLVRDQEVGGSNPPRPDHF